MSEDETAATDPIDVLVVASWFPAYDDPANGRFVADQTEAIAATGSARPAVVSFDSARLSGGAQSRTRQAATVLGTSIEALRQASPLFVAPAYGVDSALPVARLSVPEGMTRPTGAEHAVVHRETVLRAVAERLATEAGGNPARGVVHAHTVYPDGAAAVVLAERLGWPLVITEHSSFVAKIVAEPSLRARYESAVARAHTVLAVSDMLARELQTTFPDLASRIEVMPNAVPIDLFRAGRETERVEDQLLFVGHRKVTKGIENLLRAVAIAHGRRPTITLRLQGRSPDDATEARWHALAAALGITDLVSFEPAVDRAGIAEAMARASLFVHPSPRETFGVVAVEALAAGLPVVATDSGGVSEIVGPAPEEVGALVAVDDPEALADAIVRTLERRASFDPTALRATVERRFGAEYVAERLLVVYRQALAAQPLAAAAADGGAAAFATGTFIGAPNDPSAAAWPPPRRTVIVALDRGQAADRLGPLPEDLRAHVDLVTSVEPSGVPLPTVRRVIEVAIATDWRPPSPATPRRRGIAARLARLATDPVGTVLRRLGRGAGSEVSLRPATEAVRRLAADGGESLDVLPLDGHDYLALAPLVEKRIVGLSPGGLRRLADTWHASGDHRPGPTPDRE